MLYVLSYLIGYQNWCTGIIQQELVKVRIYGYILFAYAFLKSIKHELSWYGWHGSLNHTKGTHRHRYKSKGPTYLIDFKVGLFVCT